MKKSLQTVRINEDVIYREVDGEIVAMNITTGDYVGFDSVGSRIWRLLERFGSLAQVRDGLMSEFAVDEATCVSELDAFVGRLQSRGLVTLEPTDREG